MKITPIRLVEIGIGILALGAIAMVLLVWAYGGRDAARPFLNLALGLTWLAVSVQWLRRSREEIRQRVQEQSDVRYVRAFQSLAIAGAALVTLFSANRIAQSPIPFTS